LSNIFFFTYKNVEIRVYDDDNNDAYSFKEYFLKHSYSYSLLIGKEDPFFLILTFFLDSVEIKNIRLVPL
jgi:hypothetical protein